MAAGCPVLIKPALETPLSALALVELLHEAGLPADWARVVLPESHEAAEALVTDKRTRFFSFIGSARVGWHLKSRLAAGTRCALEHGGVAPLIVASDADIERAVATVAKGGFTHAGQVCVSIQRVFAHKSVARRFADALAAAAKQLVVGDPLDEATDVGPLIRSGEVTRVHEWVQEAVSGGAELLCGGAPTLHQSYEPTVLFNPPADARVMTQEVFGPVVVVSQFDALDDAIARANSLDFAFQAAIFTDSLQTARHAASRLDASAVMVNDTTAFRVDGMPFHGLKSSGFGIGGIPHTYHDMTIEKMIVFN